MIYQFKKILIVSQAHNYIGKLLQQFEELINAVARVRKKKFLETFGNSGLRSTDCFLLQFLYIFFIEKIPNNTLNIILFNIYYKVLFQ